MQGFFSHFPRLSHERVGLLLLVQKLVELGPFSLCFFFFSSSFSSPDAMCDAISLSRFRALCRWMVVVEFSSIGGIITAGQCIASVCGSPCTTLNMQSRRRQTLSMPWVVVLRRVGRRKYIR